MATRLAHLLSSVAAGAVVLVALCGAPAVGSPFYIDWEGDDWPESVGYIRAWGNWQGPNQGDGAYRTLENGVLTYDSLYDPGFYDHYYMQRPGQMDPQPGESLDMEWRLKVQTVNGPDDPEVGLFSDEAWAVCTSMRSLYVNAGARVPAPTMWIDSDWSYDPNDPQNSCDEIIIPALTELDTYAILGHIDIRGDLGLLYPGGDVIGDVHVGGALHQMRPDDCDLLGLLEVGSLGPCEMASPSRGTSW